MGGHIEAKQSPPSPRQHITASPNVLTFTSVIHDVMSRSAGGCGAGGCGAGGSGAGGCGDVLFAKLIHYVHSKR